MDITETLLQVLQSEPSVMLATIIATDGSTPASALSKMVITGNDWKGTVGGGCMEADVVQAARGLYGTGKAKIFTFHLNEDNMVQGLICGGSLHVLIEPVTRESVPLLKNMQSLQRDGEDCIMATALHNDGRVIAKRMLKRNADGMNGIVDEWSTITAPGVAPDQLNASLSRVFHRAETQKIDLSDSTLLLEPVFGHPHLMIFGGGHVSRYISRTAAMAGFRVTVIDDRSQYANRERFPEADATLAVEFYDAFNHLHITPSGYVVIVTRGHRSDEEILEQVIASQAKYIGMIGSKRKILTTYEHLVERGVSPEQLKRIHAPMGIEIGAATAEEIAVSVVAELIQVRRNVSVTENKSSSMLPLINKLGTKK